MNEPIYLFLYEAVVGGEQVDEDEAMLGIGPVLTGWSSGKIAICSPTTEERFILPVFDDYIFLDGNLYSHFFVTSLKFLQDKQISILSFEEAAMVVRNDADSVRDLHSMERGKVHELERALIALLNCPDLNLDSLDEKTEKAIEEAQRLL